MSVSLLEDWRSLNVNILILQVWKVKLLNCGKSLSSLCFEEVQSYGPRQANLVLIAYASSEVSGETAHPCADALIQAASQGEPSDRKPDPWPLWMAGHAQLKFVMTECSKTQIRLTGLILFSYTVQYFFNWTCFCHTQTTKAHISPCIHAVWWTPLLFTP